MAAAKRRISILGSTGSIGVSTLDVIEQLGGRDAFEVLAITGSSNIPLLAEQARASGARLAVLEPTPRGPRDPNPLNCLGIATYQEECQFSSSAGPFWLEQDLRALDVLHENMWSIDLDRMICPALPSCDAVIDGVVVHLDDAHLTRRFALTLAQPIGDELRVVGALDP